MEVEGMWHLGDAFLLHVHIVAFLSVCAIERKAWSHKFCSKSILQWACHKHIQKAKSTRMNIGICHFRDNSNRSVRKAMNVYYLTHSVSNWQTSRRDGEMEFQVEKLCSQPSSTTNSAEQSVVMRFHCNLTCSQSTTWPATDSDPLHSRSGNVTNLSIWSRRQGHQFNSLHHIQSMVGASQQRDPHQRLHTHTKLHETEWTLSLQNTTIIQTSIGSSSAALFMTKQGPGASKRAKPWINDAVQQNEGTVGFTTF